MSITATSLLYEQNDRRIIRRLNLMASTQYPLENLYEQSFQIFNYIYKESKYMTEDTVLNHAKLLFKIGKAQEAQNIMNKFINFEKLSQETNYSHSKDVRRLGLLYKLSGDIKKSDSLFKSAIEIDKKDYDNSKDNNQKALTLYSIAKTYEAKDDYINAIEVADRAMDIANSAKIQRTIYRHINGWKKEIRKGQ